MTTVKEFKDLGVEFVDGDVCREIFNKHWWKSATSTFDGEVVTSFAWRPLNTIPDNPKFKYERTGSIDSKPMWRPLLDQSEVIKSRDEPMPKLKSLSGRFKHYEDDEIATQKPVFTQAMADAGELPPVGSEVAYARNYCYLDTGITSNLVDGEPLSVISHKSVEGVTVAVVWSYKSEVATSLRSECYKPIYIRTPKQKAVDDLKTDILNFYGYNDGDGYKSLSEYLNEIGYRKID